MNATVLAHQGGWDEALFVIGPMVVIVLLLRLAKSRAERARSLDHDPPATGAVAPDPPAPDRRSPTAG